MKKSLYVIFVLFASCSSTVFLPGYKQSTKINADGKLDDWSLPLKYGSDDGKYQYSITNDDKNIYIALSSFDPNSQRSILRGGIDFYFDISGKKSKSIHLHYPEKNGEEFTIEGFQKLDAGTYSIQDPTNILAGMNASDQNNLGIEMIIPKILIAQEGKFKKNQINIGIAVGTSMFNRGENRNGSMQRGGSSREGMGQGGFGGGMGGGMRGGGMGGGMRGGGMRGGGMRGGGNFGAETGLIGGKQSINWNGFIF
jgi:hypothetical protein